MCLTSWFIYFFTCRFRIHLKIWHLILYDIFKLVRN